MVSVESGCRKSRISSGNSPLLRERDATQKHVLYGYGFIGATKKGRTYFCITTTFFFWFRLGSTGCRRLVGRIKRGNVSVPKRNPRRFIRLFGIRRTDCRISYKEKGKTQKQYLRREYVMEGIKFGIKTKSESGLSSNGRPHLYAARCCSFR